MRKIATLGLMLVLTLASFSTLALDKKKKAKKYKEDLAVTLARLDKEAHAALAAKDFAKAVALFNERIGIADQYPVAHYWLGVIALSKKDQPEAKAQFLAALEVDPFYPDPYLRLTGIAQSEKNMDDMTRNGRRFLALAPDHAKAPAVASVFGLEKRDGIWATEAEAKAVKEYAVDWHSRGFEQEQIYGLKISQSEKGFVGNVSVDPVQIILWDGIPSGLLAYRQNFESKSYHFLKITEIKLLVQGKNRVVIFLPTTFHQDLVGGNQGITRSLHKIEGSRIMVTTSHSEEKAGKYFQEVFPYEYTTSKKLSTAENGTLWSDITELKEKEIKKRLDQLELGVFPNGSGQFLRSESGGWIFGGHVSLLIRAHLLTRTFEDDLRDVFFLGLSDHSTGGEIRLQYVQINKKFPIVFTKIRLTKLEKTTTKIGSVKKVPTQKWKADASSFWLSENKQLLKLSSGSLELTLATPITKGK